MNKIEKKILLAGDKLIPEMHLRQTGFRYSATGAFTINKKRMQKFKETGDSRYFSKRTTQNFLSAWYDLRIF